MSEYSSSIRYRPYGVALITIGIGCLLAFPLGGSAFQVDIACQIFLASIGAVSLMLLTGYAGQLSLGHAGLIGAGAFTVGILNREIGADIWLTIPAAALTGAALGLVFGLPSLRLRGLYLLVSTLGLHFLVVYLGGEYEAKRGYSTGITIEPPVLFGFELYGGRVWYYSLLLAAALSLWLAYNLVHSRTGRAWRAIQSHQTVAASIGINVAKFKVVAFVVASAMTSVAGALFAYYQGFVSVEAFSLYLAIQYVAMVIIGGMGSLLGAVLGAIFVTVFPYGIEWVIAFIPYTQRYAGSLFAVNYAAFGVLMIFFLQFEPQGLIGIWHRMKTAFVRPDRTREARKPSADTERAE